MSNKNETVTYSVKLDAKTKEELLSLIETESEGTAGDFIEVLINTYKTNKVSNAVMDTKSELKELNILTSRIYNLYSNLIEKHNIALNNIKADFQGKLSEKDKLIEELEKQLEERKITNENLSNKISKLNEEYFILKKKKDELEVQSEKDNKLIARLENDIEELHEIKKLNKELNEQIENFKKRIDELNKQNQLSQTIIKDKEREITNLQERIKDIEANYNEQLKKEIRKLELDKQQEILEIKNYYQDAINEKDKEIESVKNEKIQAIENYLAKIERLQNDKIELENKLRDLYDKKES